MLLSTLSFIFVLLHALFATAAPHHARNWQGRWAFRHRINGTSFSRCGSPTGSVSILPSITDTASSLSVESPSSSTIEPGSSSPVEQEVESTFVPPATTSETFPETSVATQSTFEATASSAVASPTADSTSSTSDADKQAWLDGHNQLRQQHGASALTWSDTLASAAQDWANGCVFEHSGGQYGENLYAGTGNVSPSNAVSAWAAEATDYDPSNPTYSHFTQMVWKSTTELGCALALCDGIFDASYGKASYYVCEYNPPGNVIGQFAENVQA